MKYIRKGLAFTVVAVITLALFTAQEIYRYAQTDETRPADAAIVLGAAVFGDQPSPVFRERINHAIVLYQAGQVGKLIFTGGEDEDGRSAEALIAKQYAMTQGVPEADILVETTSKITWENLANAQRVAEANGLATFLIVSDPLHMKRAMTMAQDLGMVAYSSPTPTTRYRTWRSQLGFLGREVFFYWQHVVIRPLLT